MTMIQQTIKINEDLMTQELLREQQMFDKGNERFMERVAKNTKQSTQNNPHKLVSGALPRVSSGIREFIAQEEAKGDGRKHFAYSILKGMDPDLLAYIGLNACIDGTSIGGARTSVVNTIGHRIELEDWAAGLKHQDSKLAQRIENHKSVKEQGVEYYKIRAAKKLAENQGYKRDSWDGPKQCKVGGKVLSVVLEFSDIFDEWTKTTKKQTTKMIGLTEEASQLLADMDFEAAWKEPMLAPMVVPPRPWTAVNTGCYQDMVTAAQVPLVRGSTYVQRKAIQHQIDKSEELPQYMEALNAIQATPLQVNNYVLDAVKWTWHGGYEDQGLAAQPIDKFPQKDNMPYVMKPKNFSDLTPDEQKTWSFSNNKIRAKNREIGGGRNLMNQDLSTADEMTGFDEFFLPWNLDFRGRAYCVPHFSYHRDDHIKALFLLKNAKPMDDNAAFWLAVHVANTGDFGKVSKKSLEDRAAWVERKKMLIYAIGRDYQGTYRIWSKADKPFQFLAACHEFANYMDYGDAYECGLAPNLDGTNSGVQHYAAASLNEDDGRLVNLVPSPKPQDVYGEVAAVTKTMVEEVLDTYVPKDHISKEGNLIIDQTLVYAAAWLKLGITRYTVKRNTMTFGYSSCKYGFGTQLYDDFMKPLADQVMRGNLEEHPFGKTKFEQEAAARFLADINYTAVKQVIRSASVGMKFFQAAVGVLAHEGKHLRFDNPVGFPLVQKYTFWDIKKVKIYMFDRVAGVQKRTQINFRVPSEAKTNNGKSFVDKKKSKSSVAPNIIHSMDSAHLLLTVLNAKANGVKDFFLIHDSFGTTPADTDIMYETVRRSFVNIYQDYCLFSDFKSQVAKQLSYAGLERLDMKVPEKGNLDITKVLESEYCFS